MINATRNIALQLVLVSCLALFTELVMIRWLSSYILYLGYFTNIVLIASFFGLGAGALISSKQRNNFYQFPFMLLIIVLVVAFLKIDITINSQDYIFYQSSVRELQVPLGVVAPVAFLLITMLFLPLGQRLGSLLDKLPPLQSYSWDIVGSLLGIALFTMLSFLNTHPFIWFTLIALLYAGLIPRSFTWLSSLLIFIPIGVMVWSLAASTIWSPYYKLSLFSNIYESGTTDKGYTLLANSSGHQTLEYPHRKEFIYHEPYELFDNPNYERILIIGAGAGSDTAIALERSAASIDAVEIDPKIRDIGVTYHPAKPYANDRVTTHIADGREFLETSTDSYDMIIFALTDSLTLASSYANTRLESYLYTHESIEQAKNHLTDDGIVVMYNYYRQEWLVDKIGSMLYNVFDHEPFVKLGDNTLAILIAGPGLDKLKPGAVSSYTHHEDTYTPATDDWPFLYLKQPSFPSLYVPVLASILLFVLIVIALIYRKFLIVDSAAKRVVVNTKQRATRWASQFHWHFFWLGVGFLLLETKNVINFSLLFGSTWLVNALVFFAILLAVLAANLLAMKFEFKNKRMLYIALGILLLLNLIIPLSTLLQFDLFGRYILASILTFSPIIVANLIFASSFKHTTSAHLSFGANLIGAVIGGMLEYSALLIGYHYVLILIIICYFFSFISHKRFATIDTSLETS